MPRETDSRPPSAPLASTRRTPLGSGAAGGAPPRQPTVFVVDDDPALRESLRRLMESVELPVETFADAEAFLAAYDRARPGCLLLDIRMPGMSGLELQELLNRQAIRIPVIIISAFGDVEKAVRAIKGGAVDFIKKPYKGRVLLDRIHQALALDAQIRQQEQERAATAALVALLTPRERDILDRLVVGKFPKQIALELGLSRKTVDAHRAHILAKVGANSTVDLVRMVQRLHAAPLPPPLNSVPPAPFADQPLPPTEDSRPPPLEGGETS